MPKSWSMCMRRSGPPPMTMISHIQGGCGCEIGKMGKGVDGGSGEYVPQVDIQLFRVRRWIMKSAPC